MSRCLVSALIHRASSKSWTSASASRGSRDLHWTSSVNCKQSSAGSKSGNGGDRDHSDPPTTRSVIVPATTEKSSKGLKTVDPECSTHKAKNFDITDDTYDNRQGIVKFHKYKPLESVYEANRPIKNPYKRTWDVLTGSKKTKFLKEGFDAYYDIAIIGGGAIGSCIAYFLANRILKGHKIAVIERDPTYQHACTTLSVGGIRQQFSLPENVEMSLYGADFLRNASRLLQVDGLDPPDMRFQPHGYLFLASEEGAEIMQENNRVQLACGAKVELMTAKRLKRRFPWLNTDGIALGSYGYENEGWFDPWSFLFALRSKNIDLGVHYIHGDVINIAHGINRDKEYNTPELEIEDEMKRLSNRVEEAHIHLPDGDVWPLTAGVFIIAAGANSGHVANLAGIGCGPDLLQVPLPVEPRKRYVYNFHAPRGPGLSTPLVVDPSGAYFRREGMGNHYLCGMSPEEHEEPDVNNPDVDYEWFENKIWPILANRVPAFEDLKVKSAWAGYYDYNVHDQNTVVGNHPKHPNVWFATGCSGHGIQQAPAIGRALSELILDANYSSIKLRRFNFERIINDEYVLERNIV